VVLAQLLKQLERRGSSGLAVQMRTPDCGGPYAGPPITMPRRRPKANPGLQAHKEWLGDLQLRGLLVAPAALWSEAEKGSSGIPHPRSGVQIAPPGRSALGQG
jgi:hypothetical protein